METIRFSQKDAGDTAGGLLVPASGPAVFLEQVGRFFVTWLSTIRQKLGLETQIFIFQLFYVFVEYGGLV